LLCVAVADCAFGCAVAPVLLLSSLLSGTTI
jgi:hypothetical protein